MGEREQRKVIKIGDYLSWKLTREEDIWEREERAFLDYESDQSKYWSCFEEGQNQGKIKVGPGYGRVLNLPLILDR